MPGCFAQRTLDISQRCELRLETRAVPETIIIETKRIYPEGDVVNPDYLRNGRFGWNYQEQVDGASHFGPKSRARNMKEKCWVLRGCSGSIGEKPPIDDDERFRPRY